MQLNKIEKIVVIILVLGLILVGGYFLFVAPGVKKIDTAKKTLQNNRTEQAELNDRLSRLTTIDADIDAQKNDAVKYEGTFYPDLTTYETSEIAMAFMKKCGLESHSISISPISARTISLEHYTPTEIGYALKSFARSASASDGNEDVKVAGTFEDGGKTYSISVAGLNDVSILKEDGTPVDTYTEKMLKVYKGAVCAYCQEMGISETVAATEATYEIKGKYSDYLKFIDYIYELPRATAFSTVAIPMTVDPKANTDGDSDDMALIGEDGYVYSASEAKNTVVPVNDNTEIVKTVTIIFYCVEPMQSMHSVDADGETIIVDQRPAAY